MCFRFDRLNKAQMTNTQQVRKTLSTVCVRKLWDIKFFHCHLLYVRSRSIRTQPRARASSTSALSLRLSANPLSWRQPANQQSAPGPINGNHLTTVGRHCINSASCVRCFATPNSYISWNWSLAFVIWCICGRKSLKKGCTLKNFTNGGNPHKCMVEAYGVFEHYSWYEEGGNCFSINHK